MNIDQLLSKHSDNYRFHGVQAETLEVLVAQADGSIALWGSDHDEHIDNQDGEFDSELVQGQGFLYTTTINDIEMSYSEFIGESGLVLVLEKVASEPFEVVHPTDRRQRIIKVEDWKVIGGLRPVFDEDGDVIDQEVVSLSELLEM
jgi:hypothetical protein